MTSDETVHKSVMLLSPVTACHAILIRKEKISADHKPKDISNASVALCTNVSSGARILIRKLKHRSF